MCRDRDSAKASSSFRDTKPWHHVDSGVKPAATFKMSYSCAFSSPSLHAEGDLPSEIFLTFHQRQWRQMCRRCIRGKKHLERIFRWGCWHGVIKNSFMLECLRCKKCPLQKTSKSLKSNLSIIRTGRQTSALMSWRSYLGFESLFFFFIVNRSLQCLKWILWNRQNTRKTAHRKKATENSLVYSKTWPAFTFSDLMLYFGCTDTYSEPSERLGIKRTWLQTSGSDISSEGITT